MCSLVPNGYLFQIFYHGAPERIYKNVLTSSVKILFASFFNHKFARLVYSVYRVP